MFVVLFVFLLAFHSSFAILGVGRSQSVSVEGQLICNGQPASGVKVKLYDNNLALDSYIDESDSNISGQFKLTGTLNEFDTLDPKVNIYHKCNYHGLCYRKYSIHVPSSYVTDGSTPQNVYNIGTLNLANEYSDETIDCIN